MLAAPGLPRRKRLAMTGCPHDPDPVPGPEGAAGAHRGAAAPAAGCRAGALPVRAGAGGRGAGGQAGRILRRPALRGRQQRHRCPADRHDGRGDRAGRRRVPARLHLHRDGRGAAGAGRDAGVRRCGPADLPDRPGAVAGPHRPGARRRAAAPARPGGGGPVRAARGLAGAERHRGGGGAVHAGRLRPELRRRPAWRPAGHDGACDHDQLLPQQAAGRLWRRRRPVHRGRRPRRAVSQPAHARGGHDALRGAADRHERAAGHHAGGDPAGEAGGVRRRVGDPGAHRRHLRPAAGQPAGHAGARARRAQRLGDLCRLVAGCGHAHAGAGRVAGAWRADRDLLPPPAAPAARLCRAP